MFDSTPVLRALLPALAALPLLAGAQPPAAAQDMTPQVLTLHCLAKTGEGLEIEGGSMMTYFSAGTAWTATVDLDNALGSVDLRIDRQGNQITFAEKYRLTINADFYVLQSTEIKTGVMSNGVTSIHDIETTIDRHTAGYKRVLRIEDMNANTGTYKYLTETGECSATPSTAATPTPPNPVKF